jgi:hypothetical protein
VKKKKLKSVTKLFAGPKGMVKVVKPTHELSEKDSLFTRYDGNYPEPKTKIEKAIYKQQQEQEASSTKMELAAVNVPSTTRFESSLLQLTPIKATTCLTDIKKKEILKTMDNNFTVSDIHLAKTVTCRTLVELLVKVMTSTETKACIDRDDELFSILAYIPTELLVKLEKQLNTILKNFPPATGTPVIPKNLDEASIVLHGRSNKKLRVQLNKRLVEEAQKLMADKAKFLATQIS